MKNRVEMNEQMLVNVNGGFDIDDIPMYNEIADYCQEKGSNLAFTLCIYYIPSPLCYEIIEYIEKHPDKRAKVNKEVKQSK